MSIFQKPAFQTEWLTRHVLQLGYSQNQIFEAAGLCRNSNKAMLKRLPYPNTLKLLDWLAKEHNNPHYGFDLNEVFKPEDLDLVVLMVFQAPTLRDFFDTLITHQSLLISGIELAFKKGPLECEFSFNLVMQSYSGARIFIDFVLKLIIDVIRQSIKSPWVPLRTELSYPEPENLERLHKEISEKVLFDQSRNCIFFETYLLDLPISNADPKLFQLIRDEFITMRIDDIKNDNILTNIKARIAPLLSSGDCNSATIARQLNMSQRSMVRSLSALDTSIREIKAEVIVQLAKVALLESQSSIYAIALQMGFSESCSFERMFKKNTGYTPHQFREKYLYD